MIRKSGHRFSLATNAVRVCAEIMRKNQASGRDIQLTIGIAGKTHPMPATT